MVNRANKTRANGHRANGNRADVVAPKLTIERKASFVVDLRNNFHHWPVDG